MATSVNTNGIEKLLAPLVAQELEKRKKDEEIERNGIKASKKIMAFPPTSNPDKTHVKRTNFAVTWDQLRQFSITYPIARACINHRIAQITQLAWNVAPTELLDDEDEDKKQREISKEIRKFIKFPLGTRDKSLRAFLTQVIEDVLVLDAVTIEKRYNLGGDIIGWRPFDPATIELILLPDGSTPQAPQKAYLHKVNGVEISRLTTDEMYYRMMHPRTNSPYGLSPLETLAITVTTALKLQSYNLGYLTEGNVPEGFVELPKDVASSPDQLREWQEAWDAIFSGDPRYQRKLKFLPEGMKYEPTKKHEDMTFERFEKWLLLNTCAVFGVSPQDIGFIEDSNKSTSETQWEIGKERGLFPLAQFVKELMDEMIQEDLKKEDFEFIWTNLNPTNRLEEAKTFQILVNAGAISIDEWRVAEGYRPIGAANYISTPIGPIFVHDLVEQSARGLDPAMPYTQAASPLKAEAAPTAENKGGRRDTTNPETMRAQAREAATGVKTGSEGKKADGINTEQVANELRKWKKAVKNDFKLGRDYRKFYTDVITKRNQELIKYGLSRAKSIEDINAIFEPFLNQDGEKIEGLKDLYGRISNIIKG